MSAVAGDLSRSLSRDLLRALSDDPFGEWLKETAPTWQWEWAYLCHIREALQRITDGLNDRLAIFAPPRHGKSEMTTVRYPVYRLEQDPTLQVIVGAYNQHLANRFSRKARRIAEERLRLADDRSAVEEWETSEAGGVRAVGVGAGVTGTGADLIIIDDPVKSREEAQSETYRNRVHDWFRDDLYTRLEPAGAIVLIQTRWHEDDLAGRLLQEMQDGGEVWEIVELPAIAETQQVRDEWAERLGRPLGLPDPLGRLPGEPLCPDRFNLEALQRIEATLGASFTPLYQQRPVPRKGGMFDRDWFLPVLPHEVPADLQRVRFWDRAASDGKGDWTVGVLMGKHLKSGIYYVLDVVRGQWSSGTRNAEILKTAQRDGRGVKIWTEQEPGSSGIDACLEIVRLLDGFSIRYETSTGSKVDRADPYASQAEAGNVRMVKAPWNKPYLDELELFPRGRFDDQCDASSGAFNKLAGKRREADVY